ncbi:hypothetical protein VTK73DRAFT_5559 [Phialemonium thermophilum]|uniref:FAD-binding domain-containing protein n=1 Tax=Phialemonium thermophilum TaxID=223376 RepID=A0ABR3XX20_9PEZI
MGSFKVLIAGGSVSGLTLANVLEKAGIDYLVLEKRDIAPNMGASISVLCHTARVFEQLGIWNRMRDATLGLVHRQHFDEKGRLFEDSHLFKVIIAITKRPFLFMERRFYLQCLYDNLRDKSKIRTRCGIRDFEETDDGVSVTTDTGETIHGSILIGADGIHSTVRQIMSRSLEKTDPEAARNLVEGFTANYKTIFATSRNHFVNDPNRQFLPGGFVHNVYYRGYSGVAAAGVDGLVFWFLFVKLDSPVSTPNVPKYSDADIDETLRTYGDKYLGEGYTFNDLWASRVGGGMVAMEEGVMKVWRTTKRTLLLGDSAAKSTINVGLGGNTAVEGVTALANELIPAVRRSGSSELNVQDIQEVFARFETRHRPRANLCVTGSHYITRFEAMDTWWLRLLRRISPWLPDSVKAKGFLDFMAPAPILHFLPNPDAVEA